MKYIRDQLDVGIGLPKKCWERAMSLLRGCGEWAKKLFLRGSRYHLPLVNRRCAESTPFSVLYKIGSGNWRTDGKGCSFALLFFRVRSFFFFFLLYLQNTLTWPISSFFLRSFFWVVLSCFVPLGLWPPSFLRFFFLPSFFPHAFCYRIFATKAVLFYSGRKVLSAKSERREENGECCCWVAQITGLFFFLCSLFFVCLEHNNDRYSLLMWQACHGIGHDRRR